MVCSLRFPNKGCAGDSAKNGTCYTAEECAEKGGTASGSCAMGYGVCCICKNTYSAFVYTVQADKG